MQPSCYIIITPVRDEEQFLEQTIDSVRAQTVRPTQWILVNDGSTDNTGRIIQKAAADLDWVTAFTRSDRGIRQAGGGVIDAFYDGFKLIHTPAWEYLVKLDGDVSFAPDYFARCFEHFRVEPKLGIAGGTVCESVRGELVPESSVDPAFHVRGATKMYRAACWNDIGGLIHKPGWDTVDEFKANMLGWRTRTFPEIRLVHHRHAGAAYGQWHNWTKNGLANYVAGYHPLFMLLKCFRRAFHRPLFLVATGLWVGFCWGYLKGIPRIPEREVISYVRRQQLRRILRLPSVYG